VKITKFVHSCLLVETPERTVLFDPGSFSQSSFNTQALDKLNDIFITHQHGDHFSLDFVKELVAKFPDVRITAPESVVAQLGESNIIAGSQPPEGVTFFDSPHESVEPLFSCPEEIGYHYLDKLSHPGDSHSFTETKDVLALPVSAPWGSLIGAVNLALELRPKHVLPIHDWHWNDKAREQNYNILERVFADNGITFHQLVDGEAITIE